MDYHNENYIHTMSRTPRIIGDDELKAYSVIVPFIKEKDEWYVLFEKRTKGLRNHPGEISFPGGKVEDGETLLCGAIRETMEELLIEEKDIEVFCVGDVFLSPFQIKIQPYMAKLNNYKDTFSSDEVDKIIKIPLEFFQTTEAVRSMSNIVSKPVKDFPFDWIPGGENYPWLESNYSIYFYHYQDTVIWGMTARILRSVLGLLEEYKIQL